MSCPDEEKLEALKNLFGSMADVTRLKILYCLSKQDLCVYELSGSIGMSPSAVSHQLRLLRHAGLVRFMKQGKHSVYTLYDNHVHDLFRTGFEHIGEKEPRDG
ncbi:MAG: metalloregulator ArsR/SmtB family transcription factor [Clostridia bacterium]